MGKRGIRQGERQGKGEGYDPLNNSTESVSSHPRGQRAETCQPFAFSRLTIALQIYNKYT